MSKKPVSLTLQAVDALLALLPEIEGRESFGRMVETEGHWFHAKTDDLVRRFVHAAYEHGWVAQFDWTSWQQESAKYVQDPAALDRADLTTLCRLITTHLRADRFCEGHLLSMFETGHIEGILRRLRDLRDTEHFPVALAL